MTRPDSCAATHRFVGLSNHCPLPPHLTRHHPTPTHTHGTNRYESVIHEFDPYFNFRTTKYLASEGFLEFLDWFDDR